jgi:hypothetical protein
MRWVNPIPLVVRLSSGIPASISSSIQSAARVWARGSPPPERRTDRVPAFFICSTRDFQVSKGISFFSPRRQRVEQKKQLVLQRSVGCTSTWYGPP